MKCSFVGCKSQAKEGLFGLIEYKGAGNVVFPLCRNHWEVIKEVEK